MGDGVGSDVSGVDRLGSGACSWAMRAFPLVLFSFQRTFEIEIVSEAMMKS